MPHIKSPFWQSIHRHIEFLDFLQFIVMQNIVKVAKHMMTLDVTEDHKCMIWSMWEHWFGTDFGNRIIRRWSIYDNINIMIVDSDRFASNLTLCHSTWDVKDSNGIKVFSPIIICTVTLISHWTSLRMKPNTEGVVMINTCILLWKTLLQQCNSTQTRRMMRNTRGGTITVNIISILVMVETWCYLFIGDNSQILMVVRLKEILRTF